ncbi:hypothetical protein GCM10007285_36450 [Stappia taiwanensis]|nr:hypothetical protein GCM10007285_36450 [Stappia taiwanensis]
MVGREALADLVAGHGAVEEPYRFSAEPAQYMMHLWQEGTGRVSHVVSVAPAQ